VEGGVQHAAAAQFAGLSDTGGVRGAVQAEGGGERTLCGLRSGYALPPPTQYQAGRNPLTLTGLENGGMSPGRSPPIAVSPRRSCTLNRLKAPDLYLARLVPRGTKSILLCRLCGAYNANDVRHALREPRQDFLRSALLVLDQDNVVGKTTQDESGWPAPAAMFCVATSAA